MKNTRTKNVVLIAATSTIRQIINLLSQFVSRTVFIYVLGAEYLGLNGLFTNILSILSLAELGIGSAISFYLYKPIAENDENRIRTLLAFYKSCYRFVGIIILLLGLLLSPFLPILVNSEIRISENIYLAYILFLMCTVASYLALAYKQALPMANQEQYKVEALNSWLIIINSIIDIVVLVIGKRYIIYLFEKLLFVIIRNAIIAYKIDSEYPYIKGKATKKISKDERKLFFKGVGNVTLFRLGSTLYNSTDNILISLMVGTTVVGYYSNYMLIISCLTTAISIIIRAFSASVGNVIATENQKTSYKLFLQIDLFTFFITSVASVTIFQVMNLLIYIWLGHQAGQEYVLSHYTVFFICLNFYMDGTTQTMNLFREATGHFEIGQLYQVLGGIANIVLSFILGKMCGLNGIFAATVVSKFFISLFPFMLKISKCIFGENRFTILFRYVKEIIATLLSGVATWSLCSYIVSNPFTELFIKTVVSSVVTIFILTVFFYRTSEFQANYKKIKMVMKGKF